MAFSIKFDLTRDKTGYSEAQGHHNRTLLFRIADTNH